MDLNKTIEILEALAAGYSPISGEELSKESVLNERTVIRALQVAIDFLQKDGSRQHHGQVKIDEMELKSIMNFFTEQGRNATSNSLVGFYLGIRKFKNEQLIANPLYGKLRNVYTKGQLLDYFNQYFSERQSNDPKDRSINPYGHIDFFRQETFNTLSEKAVHQLIEKVNSLGVTKTENLSEYIKIARVNYPRAYEPWSEVEKELLSKAIKYTNDLDLLSKCFQRGTNSIESAGQRIIFESQKLQDGKL